MTECIVGIDEAGRGPIAGPICVGLVTWTSNVQVEVLGRLGGLNDSKKLSPKKREELFKETQKLKREKKLFYTHSLISSKVIDTKGIVFAVNLGVKRCLSRVSTKNIEVLLDGSLRAPEEYKNQRTIIKGDQKISVISAASIVAKVVRDRKMVRLSKKYPKYGFEKHKGYGTKEHYSNIKKKGLSKIHRRSFLKVDVI